MAGITKVLGIAVADADAGRITRRHLIQVFQEAIDNGDILEAANEPYVVAAVLPLIDAGVLKSSVHVASFEKRINSLAAAWLQDRRVSEFAADNETGPVNDVNEAFPIVTQANEVGRILHAYIRVHNDIFGGGVLRTLRRLVPIPGFFLAIDFDQHSRTLRQLGRELDRVRTGVGTENPPDRLAGPLFRYSEMLLATLLKLEHMSERLSGRKDGPGSYTESEYKNDLAEYEKSVAEYRASGEHVNRAFRAGLS